MTQPTQQLPPYLSASTFTTTISGTVSTGVSTVEVPITYFGPSIPLGTDGVWTFGGSTSPPSSSPTTSTSTTVRTSSSSTATSITTSKSSTRTGITSSTVVPISTSTTFSGTPTSTSQTSSSSSSSSSSASPTLQSTSSTGNTIHKALPGIIIGSIIGFFWLLAMAYFIYRWYVRRRQRINGPYGQGNFSDFVIVDADGGSRIAGEGVARPTGGEEDSFLRRNGENRTDMMEAAGAGVLAGTDVLAATSTVDHPDSPVVDRPNTSSTTQSGRLRSNPFFGASDPSIFFNPRRTDPIEAPSPAASNDLSPKVAGPHAGASTQATTAAVTAAIGVTEMGERSQTPLRPPPVLNPDAVRPTTVNWHESVEAPHSNLESPGDDPDESVTLLTARRVMMSEAGQSQVTSINSPSPNPSWLGLGELARLRRMSWFQRMHSARGGTPRMSRPGTPGDRLSTDLEQRGALRVRDSTYNSDRPLSYLSTYSALSSSGNTVFHDAQSSISTGTRPGTPAATVPPVPPIPSVTSVPPIPRTPPPSYSATAGQGAQAIDQTRHSRSSVSERDDVPGIVINDVLDEPPPSRVSTYSTRSTRSAPTFPPGLEDFRPNAWRESNSDMPTAASFGSGSDAVGIALGMDMLEDAPPQAGAGWSSLRAFNEPDRRYTLGQPLMMTTEYNHSERASLHSMESHLSPLSPVASGSNLNSRAPSRHTHYGSSYGSGSSRSRREGSDSLAHSTSISSDGRQRARREPGEPPAMPGFGRASLTAMGSLTGFPSPPRSPEHNASFSSTLTGPATIRSPEHIIIAPAALALASPRGPNVRWSSERDYNLLDQEPPSQVHSFTKPVSGQQKTTDQDTTMFT